MNLANTYEHLNNDLQIIEKTLDQTIQANHPVLRQAATQLLQAGGKRIRPVFVLLSSQVGNYDLEQTKRVAVPLELIHMATLVHDDVIDDAELRRGQPTIKKRYGNKVAMYTGDYLLSIALEKIATLENKQLHKVLSHAIVEVCLGEIEQIKDQFNWQQHLRHYLRRIKRKTALLIATSCKLGAIVGETPSNVANKLYKYGYYVGMSYQIIDDILDFTSTPEELGKPTGSDLIQGNITLPTLFAMQDNDFNERLQYTFSNKEKTDSTDRFNELIDMIVQSDAIKHSYDVSNWYLTKALDALDSLPNSEAKNTLESIANYIGKRRK